MSARGKCHALLHSAGELPWVGAPEPIQPDQGDYVPGHGRPTAALGMWLISSGRMIFCRAVRQGIRLALLEDEADLAPRRGQRLPPEAHVAGDRLQQARQQTQQGALAAA